jgi:hypothetical protein
LKARLEAADKAIKAQRARDARDAVQAAVKRGALAPKDEALQAKWQGWCEASPEMIEALEAMEGNAAVLARGLTRGAEPTEQTERTGARPALSAAEGPARILQAYGALAARNAATPAQGASHWEAKGKLAREMAVLYARDIRPRLAEFDGMPLNAADVTDTNLGALSGTLVAQRCLELFKLQFPVLSRITTDFSDIPAQFRQTVTTRVIVVPAVQSYSTTPDSSGRPTGWSPVTPAQTTDVSITLDEHVGVPIVFDGNMLASTVRRLFDEQAPAASYALAKYFVEKIYKLITPANFNAYAKTNKAFVPTAYPTFTAGLVDFSRGVLAKIAAVLNPNQVPLDNRFCLLNSAYHEQLACDPSIITFFSGQRAPEIVTDLQLPRLAGFQPIEAPNLTNTNTTPNLVGFAGHKAGLVAMTRLSNDYTQALPGSSYGSVTTVTDPDLGISVVLVQYVNHTGGYAEWRIQVFLGAAVGDPRGGLCITSQ